MKKTLLLFIIIIIIYVFIGDLAIKNNIIPKDAIRIRIIANSNLEYDQEIKNKVKNGVEDNLYTLLKNTKSTQDARLLIKNNLDKIDNNVNNILKENNYLQTYEINFGQNYFPEKTYKGVTYEEGYYESLVIVLGEGLGDNWWCVLFPPLCQIEQTDDVQYTTVAKELLNKYSK